jgi:hypothetical protein
MSATAASGIFPVKNAKTLPKVYYGLHMVEGVAEYREPNVNDGKPYRIFIGEETIKNMDPTFQGRPVYVHHVNDVDLENIQRDADGWVVESFFNKCDGKHWVKFIVVSDRGHEAIRSGWKLSNAYVPNEMSGGGLWHGVEYAKEVKRGEYEHLAIVPNPRYEESEILTPEQFKSYTEKKELELKRLANSQGDESMLSFFKKAKVENSAELEGTSVVLPKSKKEMTIAQVINAMDEHEMKAKEPQMANGDHHVMVGDEKMTVNELIAKHLEMKSGMDKKNEDQADLDAKAAEADGEGELVPNAEDDKDKKADKKEDAKKNAADEEAAKKKKENFDKVKNAEKNARVQAAEATVDLSQDMVARGKSRYGSGK